MNAHTPFALLIAAALAAWPAGAIERETGSVATLPPVGSHWVWVPDAFLAHSLLFDGDDGEVLATIDAGTTSSPKPPLFSPERGEFYSVEIDYSRGRRGDRLDFVTIYDAESLEVIGEVILPTKTSESAASIGYAALLDGGRFLAAFNQFPATSVSIVDLEARSFVGEIPIAGCAGVYATGPRSFGSLCGDGTVLSVALDDAGRVLGRSSSEPFFDAVDDPVMMAGVRLGRRWMYVSFEGVLHDVDFGASPPRVSGWPLIGEADRDEGWRPGGRQLLALHRATQRLYALVHRGGPGTHKDPGPEVWIFDLSKRERVDRFRMLHLILDGGGAHTIAVTQDASPLLFARNADVGVVAVLDARTGEPLRYLEEAGFAGMRLEVPR
jgi:methylamine dehydrogenase heavy chain